MKPLESWNVNARNIFTACSRMKGKVDWEIHSGSEWLFIGEGADFREKRAEELTQTFFGDSEIYLVIDRHTSFPVRADEAVVRIKELMSLRDVTLCNFTFDKMMVFNPLGVMKRGEVRK